MFVVGGYEWSYYVYTHSTWLGSKKNNNEKLLGWGAPLPLDVGGRSRLVLLLCLLGLPGDRGPMAAVLKEEVNLASNIVLHFGRWSPAKCFNILCQLFPFNVQAIKTGFAHCNLQQHISTIITYWLIFWFCLDTLLLTIAAKELFYRCWLCFVSKRYFGVKSKVSKKCHTCWTP